MLLVVNFEGEGFNTDRLPGEVGAVGVALTRTAAGRLDAQASRFPGAWTSSSMTGSTVASTPALRSHAWRGPMGEVLQTSLFKGPLHSVLSGCLACLTAAHSLSFGVTRHGYSNIPEVRSAAQAASIPEPRQVVTLAVCTFPLPVFR